MHSTIRDEISRHTASIVSAYVTKHNLAFGELAKLIEEVHLALVRAPAAAAEPEPPVPAVPINKSVTRDHIVSLENGRKFKALKRHLSKLGMTPDEYRAKWGLARDYPMVAPSYAERRSALAKSIGLGRKKTATPTKKPATPASRKRRTRKNAA